MPTIFVQIASYRDPELVATVDDALQKATYPYNLSFGIVWQGKPGEDCIPLQRLDCCRLLLIDSDRSRGVCWARAKTQTLWDGEPYVLQIDSHMRFVPGWDELLLTLLQQCPSAKPVLTAYPPPYTPPDTIHPGAPTRLGVSHFNDQGSLSLESTLSLGDYSQPQLGMFMAAGFWFAAASFLQAVPYDPHLYFYGEETNLALRAWTHGWDIYHPHRIVCYHEYMRHGKPRHWEEHSHWWQLEQLSQQRLRQLLCLEPGGERLGPYGLGRDRSLRDYESFSGVNFQQQTITSLARSGIPQVNDRHTVDSI